MNTNPNGLIRTDRTYKTFANAHKALALALNAGGDSIDTARWIIAATADGRFAPVLVGEQYIRYIHAGLTVVG